MTLREYSEIAPLARVRVNFKNAHGTGVLVCTLAHALNPNQSNRYFPPKKGNAYMTPAELGWPVPWWYQEEVTNITLLG